MRRFALLAAAALSLSACGEDPPAGEDLQYAPVNDGPLSGPSANTILPPDGNAVVVDPATNTPVTNTPATNTPDTAQPATGPAADYRTTLRLTGTEPFWGAQIGQKIVLQRPDHPSITTANAGPTINGNVAVWTTRELSIRLEPGNCSDGMSDNRYPYNATVTVAGGEVLKGCAARLDKWPRGGG